MVMTKLAPMKKRLAHTAFALLVPALFFPGPVVRGQSLDVKVMSFNVWTADGQTAKLAEIIQAGNADMVGLQEMNNASGQELANQLGWHYESQSGGDIQVVSRFPIVDQTLGGVQIEVTPGHDVWLFNAHFAPYPYQPYDLRDNPNLTEAQLIASANNTRGNEFDTYINSINSSTSEDERVFVTGDFNEPSHLDWTADAAAATPRTFDKKVTWPGSEKLGNAGFADSFRSLRPDEVNDRGYTWTTFPGANEVHDRIDFVYSRGPSLVATGSLSIGLDASNSNTDIAVAGYNSDHRAVVSGFNLSGLQDSTLTFSRLIHNPGDDRALNAGDYGDRLVTTPNVTVAFSATGTSTWDTYDGDADNNGNNNWNVGVAQLQYHSGSAEYDLAFNSDNEFGVVVGSFDLVDYVDYASGHTVNWELWSGAADSGRLLASGQEIIPADGINHVQPGFDAPTSGTLTLRLEHLQGDGTDLAIDNVRFYQLHSEPTVVNVDSFLVTRGTHAAGGVADLAESDNADLSIQRSTADTESRTEIEIKGISPVASPSSLEATLEGSVFARSQVDQTIELFDYAAGGWEQIDTSVAAHFTDSSVTIAATGDLSRFVEVGTMCIKARIRYQSTVARQQFSSNTDQFIWTIGQ